MLVQGFSALRSQFLIAQVHNKCGTAKGTEKGLLTASESTDKFASASDPSALVALRTPMSFAGIAAATSQAVVVRTWTAAVSTRGAATGIAGVGGVAGVAVFTMAIVKRGMPLALSA